MIGEPRSLTPISDQVSTAQDAVSDALRLPPDTPGRLEAIITAYGNDRAAQMNAVLAGQGRLMAFWEEHTVKMMERIDDQFKRFYHELHQIDAHLDQAREAMADHLQAFVFKFEEQIQLHANEIGVIKNRVTGLEQDVEAIKRQLAALQDMVEGGP